MENNINDFENDNNSLNEWIKKLDFTMLFLSFIFIFVYVYILFNKKSIMYQ